MKKSKIYKKVNFVEGKPKNSFEGKILSNLPKGKIFLHNKEKVTFISLQKVFFIFKF
jgi:hypothetical protein